MDLVTRLTELAERTQKGEGDMRALTAVPAFACLAMALTSAAAAGSP